METNYVSKKQILFPTIFSSENLIVKNDLKLNFNNNNNIFSITETVNQRKNFNQNFKNCFSLELPPIAKFKVNNDFLAIWVRANSYLVLGNKNFKSILSKFENLASITDQSGGWVSLNIEGKSTKSLLEKLLSLDLDSFEKGSVSRTAINKINCFVLCNEKFQKYTILCPISFINSMKVRLVNLANLIA